MISKLCFIYISVNAIRIRFMALNNKDLWKKMKQVTCFIDIHNLYSDEFIQLILSFSRFSKMAIALYKLKKASDNFLYCINTT